jgi:hypothetical protein
MACSITGIWLLYSEPPFHLFQFPFRPRRSGARELTSGSTPSAWTLEIVAQGRIQRLEVLQPPVLADPDFTQAPP